MIKRLYKSLLLKHPLLWNIKLPQVILFIAISHVLFFLFGFFSVYGIIAFKLQDQFDANNLGINLIGGLILLLGLIVWLMWYLRNNAFKQFYPITVNDLRKEFLLVFLIFLLGMPIFHSFAYGKHLHLKIISRNINVEADAKIVNLARHFLPINSDDFNGDNCCDSLAAQNKRNEAASQMKTRCYETTYNNGSETTDYAAAEPAYDDTAPAASRSTLYSYLYYCQTPVSVGNDAALIHHTAKRWLINENYDSIKLSLINYFKLMDKYAVRHNVNIDTVISHIQKMRAADKQLWGSSSEFSFLTEVYDYGAFSFTPLNANQADFGGLNTAIENVAENNKDNFWSLSEWSLYGYLALGFSILLMLFRMTRLKPWISSLIGAGIWAMLFGLMGIFAQSELLYIVLIYAILSGLLAWINIRKQNHKLRSAMWLSWFSIIQLSILPLTAWMIKDATKEKTACVNGYLEVIQPAPPIHNWLELHSQTIMTEVNIVFCLLLFLFLCIPLAYRWQANPSE